MVSMSWSLLNLMMMTVRKERCSWISINLLDKSDPAARSFSLKIPVHRLPPAWSLLRSTHQGLPSSLEWAPSVRSCLQVPHLSVFVDWPEICCKIVSGTNYVTEAFSQWAGSEQVSKSRYVPLVYQIPCLIFDNREWWQELRALCVGCLLLTSADVVIFERL